VAGLGACDRRAELAELVVAERRFDLREELTLLEADMALEQLTKFAQGSWVGIRARLEVLAAG
jgi:hypothetical protein